MSDYKSAEEWMDELPTVRGYEEDIHAVSIYDVVKAIQSDARAPLLKEIQEMADIMRGWADSIEQELGYTNTAKYMREFASKHQKGHIGHEPF
jgi:hypothetical protein